MTGGPYFVCRECGKKERAAHDWELGDALYMRLKREGWSFNGGEKFCRCPECTKKERENE